MIDYLLPGLPDCVTTSRSTTQDSGIDRWPPPQKRVVVKIWSSGGDRTNLNPKYKRNRSGGGEAR